jgi:serine phosphatase RsbU (regulator of sigma subunit)
MERVNRLIYDELSGVDMFITAQIVLADIHKRRLVIANAGHCPVLVQHRDGTVESISPEGMPLGIMPDAMFEQRVVSVADSPAVILYTDGLTEARNAHGEFFGHERFISWLTQHHTASPTASELSESLKAEIKSFQGQTALSDDQTFLVLTEDLTENAPASELSEKSSPIWGQRRTLSELP